MTTTKTITFKEWSVLFTDVFGDNGKIALCYYLTAIYRKHIVKEFGFFPHLFTYGPPGCGKTILGFHLIDLMNTAGCNFDRYNAGMSSEELIYRLGYKTRGIIHFDSFDNSIKKRNLQLLISAYDIHFATSAASANRIVETNLIVKKAVYISAQRPTTNFSLAARSIMLEMTKDFTDQNKLAWEQLNKITAADLFKIKSKIKSPFFFPLIDYKRAYNAYADLLEKRIDTAVSKRVICHYAIMLTIYNLVAMRNEVPISKEEMLEVFVKKNECTGTCN